MNRLTIVAFLPLLACAVRLPAGAPAAYPPPLGRTLTVVTVNMAKETSADRVVREFAALPALRGADVLLLQEVVQRPEDRVSVANQVASAMGWHVAYSPCNASTNDQGLAILSRFPLRDVKVLALPAYNLAFHSRSRIALAATAELPSGAVRIVNSHLDTRINAADRLAQLEPAIRDEAPEPRIVGGDFNSNSFYWIGHVLPVPAIRSQAHSVQQYMTARGFSTAIPASETTFDHLGQHLDWVWSQGLRPRDWRIYPLEFSDHHAVWTQLEL